MSHGTRSLILRVDLTAGVVESEPVPEPWLEQFVGGKGLGARYLYEELTPGTDPLSPANVLSFVFGPLSGVSPGEQRYVAVTKSPQTGAFLDSYSGGEFASVLAGALCDHVGLLVVGAAERPVRLVVADGTASIEPAEGLWGEDTVTTCQTFSDAAVACIGPAGEHQVRYATIATDAGDHHAGRGGAGAVMGSKGLKAVVARGEPPDGPDQLREEYERRFTRTDVGKWYAASETLESVDFANELGVLSTRGWQEGRFEKTDDIGIRAAREAASERERPTESTPGGFRFETEHGDSVPRGATQMTLGAGLGVDKFDAVVELGDTCDRLGIDVISAGNAVAWAIRAADEGLVDRDLDFGDPEGAQTLIEEITTRQTPLGDALADGVERAAARFGGEALVPTVKGMEVPGYDPRGAASMALAYATSDRGACHRRARPIEREAFAVDAWGPEKAARTVVAEQNERALLWSLGVDDFVGAAFRDDLGAEWLAAVGRAYDQEELQLVGERIWNLVRLFNVREGFTREDDELPEIFAEPHTGEPVSDSVVERETFDEMLDAYYDHRGWDADGRPTEETVRRLGLSSTDRHVSLGVTTDRERDEP